MTRIPFQSTLWTELERAGAGDTAAYGLFVGRYRPAVVSYLRLQGVPETDAEDLAQDVFISIIRGHVLSKIDPAKGRFRHLMLAVTKHVLLNHRRERRSLKRGGANATVPLDADALPVASPEEEESFDRLWAKQLISAALRDLDAAHASHARTLRLALDGRSQAEIARQMGCSVATVNNHVHRAKTWIRKRVRQLVAEYCGREPEFAREVEHLARYLG